MISFYFSRKSLPALLIAILAIGSSSIARAQPELGSLSKEERSLSAAARSDLNALLIYRDSKGHEGFERRLTKSPAETNALATLVHSLYFVDYGMAAPELMEIFLGHRALSSARFPNLFDAPGELALDAFIRARKSLAASRVFDFGTVLSAQRDAMAGGIGGLSDDEIGEIRSKHVYGPEVEYGLDHGPISAIEESPYLRFLPATGIFADVPSGTEHARAGSRTRGYTLYPRPRDLKPAALARLKSFAPAIAARVVEYQKRFGGAWENHDPTLTRDLVTALLKERIQAYNRARAFLGELDGVVKLDRFVKLIAQFQKDFVSIHPFQDGNGRVSRLLLYFLAEREGLPASRILYPNEDVFWKKAPWAQEVREGMRATIELEKDLSARIDSGRPLEGSVELACPHVPRVIGETAVSRAEYGAYLRRRFAADPELTRTLRDDPVGTLRDLSIHFIQRTPDEICESFMNEVTP